MIDDGVSFVDIFVVAFLNRSSLPLESGNRKLELSLLVSFLFSGIFVFVHVVYNLIPIENFTA